MKIKCPHEKIVEPIYEFGIISFKHSDGSSCCMMNDLSITNEKIFLEYIKHNGINENVKKSKVAILSSRIVRFEFYNQMSRIKDEDEMVKAVKKLCDIGIDQIYLNELFEVFGAAILDNINFVANDKVFNRERDMYRHKPELNIINLKSKKTALEIEDVAKTIKQQILEVEDVAKTIKQQILDVERRREYVINNLKKRRSDHKINK
jgi:hypothetical protein